MGLLAVLVLLWGLAYAVPLPKEPVSFFDASVLKIEEEKYLGTSVPDVTFVDQSGTSHRLREFLNGRPLALILAYFSCDAACPLVVKHAVEASRGLEGRFRGLVLSFDPQDTPQDIGRFKERLHLPDTPSWHFGVMREEDIKRLTTALGYKYFYSRKDRVFVHPNVVVFLDARGRVVRYLYGITPRERDFRLAVAEASLGKVSPNSLVDLAFLACYRYNPREGRYSLNPVVVLGTAGLVLGGVTFVYAVIRRKREVQR
ncbi:conserved hypothetical protein [Thermocrinis albus DSM 14484]|uniref:Electron transport protein SCO1/SenC n=1 Tax=Thermocrinis albus (strain DSM 14484 / JCM 11386 / HI 11/12) TaxID=638303 RepID=D3SN65_THEAH|nr:SCO family protein [Thermocrinis albus]ADC90195.1 conserved hypothetical protein [Thermocrinis albus DSM 14484]